MQSASISERIVDRRLIVCVGSGGVGKTTTAAALGLQAATQGRKVLVLTIDPARRLANSLGLDGLSNEEKRVPQELLEKQGVKTEGELYAAMLDTKQSFDDLIRRITPSERSARKILDNFVYTELSNALAGSQEYVAMERLYDIMQRKEYDLVVLDTPPTKNALDFLHAPNRMASFLDENILKWFLLPQLGKSWGIGGVGSVLFRRGSDLVVKLLGLLVGEAFVRDLVDFFLEFKDLFAGFRSRAEGVYALLRDERTAFVLVTSPEFNTLDEAAYFHRKLLEFDMHPEAVIVNRAYLPHSSDSEEIDDETLRPLLKNHEELADKLPALFERLDELRQRENALNAVYRRNVARFRKNTGLDSLSMVPVLPKDVHDAGGLMAINRHLFNKD